MTPEQISLLLKLLERIADRPFTITQATDWPMVVVFFGVFGVAIGLFWRDVGNRFDSMKESLREFKSDDCKAHDAIKAECDKANEALWKEIERCQAACCPQKPQGVGK